MAGSEFPIFCTAPRYSVDWLKINLRALGIMATFARPNDAMNEVDGRKDCSFKLGRVSLAAPTQSVLVCLIFGLRQYRSKCLLVGCP